MNFKTFKNMELYCYLRDELNIDINEDKLKNKLKYASLSSMMNQGNNEHIFFCSFEDDKIIGILKLKTKGSDSRRYPGYFNWLSYCSVLDSHSNRGISSLLIELMFNYMRDNKIKDLVSSGYTEDGLKYLSPILNRSCNSMNIIFKEEQTVSF